MCEKSELRKKFKTLRAQLKDGERDSRIAKNALAAFGENASFFVYLSFGTEVSTAELIKELRARGKAVCVPRIAGGEMLCVPLSDRLKAGAFGIFEPEEGEERTCEVALCPLLAVDEAGYRLGYGGGYYDRYFASHPEVLRVGLCYRGQVVKKLPHGAHDARLDAIVTEDGVRFFPPRNT